jgi:hypothetical protein
VTFIVHAEDGVFETRAPLPPAILPPPVLLAAIHRRRRDVQGLCRPRPKARTAPGDQLHRFERLCDAETEPESVERTSAPDALAGGSPFPVRWGGANTQLSDFIRSRSIHNFVKQTNRIHSKLNYF